MQMDDRMKQARAIMALTTGSRTDNTTRLVDQRETFLRIIFHNGCKVTDFFTK